jgi:hypothetical protein
MLLAMPRTEEAERLIRLLAERDLSQSWLARRLGISPQRLNLYINGQRQPSDARFWARAEDQVRSPIIVPTVVDRPRIPVTYDPQPMRYAGEVPAGDWGDPLASEDFIDVDPAIFHSKRYAAKVVGPSCYPALHPGDLVIWHHDESPPYGMLVLAQRKEDHACTVKVLDWDADLGQPVLRPVNPDHEPPDAPNGWVAVARLVAVIRKMDGLELRWFLPEGIRPRHLTTLL